MTRVIGIGRPAGGDDAVGLEIVRALRREPLPAGVEVHAITVADRLVELLTGVRRAILIDALLDGAAPGTLCRLQVGQLTDACSAPLSSHGLGVGAAIALARTLDPALADVEIDIIGVSIAAPRAQGGALSGAVAAVVPRARRLVLELIGIAAS